MIARLTCSLLQVSRRGSPEEQLAEKTQASLQLKYKSIASFLKVLGFERLRAAAATTAMNLAKVSGRISGRTLWFFYQYLKF
jgi:hypothetical protein